MIIMARIEKERIIGRKRIWLGRSGKEEDKNV
jgi:hypothetical protein